MSGTTITVVPGRNMAAEMVEQPDRVRAAFGGVQARTEALAPLLGSARQVILLGRGSSRSASTYAAEAFRSIAGLPAAVVSPAHLAWSTSGALHGALVVAVSQSGESTEILAASRAALERGADLVVVTNSENSALGGLVDDARRLLFHAGREVAVPATKSFTTSLACLLGLAAAGQPELLREAATAVPDLMAAVLEDETTRIDVSAASDFVCAGEGYAEAVGEEGAIKLRETLSRPVASFETSEFLHGSVNSVTAGTAVLLTASDDVGVHLCEEAAREAARRGARTVTINAAPSTGADQHVRLPATPSHWAPFLAVLPLQRAAHDAAIARGLDPDTPAGLSKVTRIETAGDS
ncbi:MULTISPECIES: SIS domain-containing protein [unclassified Nocardioides]|uniref:SIS domain-containing protein n=1 Tax=unclassified Nocardioides TaxID=2615069 RepID=UPI0009EFEB1B|nr:MULTISPECIES: SIS domain-containing protein [unclassified Nocardioides]GAW48734.1 Glutamine--fructose-6-phosphate transaminase [Nocardioides sp. PD653-B2]GAW54371.1 Glutamine--fructose-6-phosphate transaminase [Nocardioides sp. PD653]